MIKLEEVHLRFHPRTDKKLSWPQKLIDLVSNYGCKVIIVNALEVPLVESIPDYVGIIGAMSGSLRTARAISRGFVIGLLNAGGEDADQNWMLGSSPGITWISNAEEIKEEHLIPPAHIGDGLPRVSEILKGLLSNKQETSFAPLREKKENIAVIIQARMGSSRLPGKVLMRVNGRTLLDYMIERVKKSKTIDKVIIATTRSSSDDLIVRWCEEVNLPFYRGSEEDVLSRYYEAAKKYNASVIVRLTSDCPLIDPEVIDSVVRCYLNRPDIDFVSNTVPLPCLYPDGMDAEVFDMDLLAKANQEATLPSEREHVTFYMWKTGKFRTYRLDPSEDLSKYRFCIDYPQDFQVVKEILTKLYSKNPDFSMYDLTAFMEANPHLLELQQGIIRNAGWQSSFVKDREALRTIKQ